jgi:predicted phosphodiesterase
MSKLKQFRDPDLSLWQSAVDEVVAQKTGGTRSQDVGGGTTVARPDTSQSMVRAAAVDLTADESNQPLQPPAEITPAVAEGALDVAKYCSNVARKLAWAIIKCDAVQEAICREQLGKYTVCDPGWAEVVEKYVEFQAEKGTVPYRVYTDIDQYVIDGKIPDNKARIAIVGDWGTGQDPAKKVLAQIVRKQPDVVIHLGDIYYSCTDFEMQQYFYNIWSSMLDLSKTPTFTLSGNHDMFAGGAAYYNLIDKLQQPASYFCLRNKSWQFVALDTGLHDRKPGGTDPTYLETTEVDWFKRRIDQAQGRRTILLTHHQLFTAFEDIVPGKAVNDTLNAQLGPLLPQLSIWIWGHEHNLVIYKKQMGILARCVGHGAFPVGLGEVPDQPSHPEIPIENFRLDAGDAFYTHGYALIDLDGTSAKISYYQDSDEDNPVFVDNL